MNLGYFIFCFLLKTGGKDLWGELKKADDESYINRVEKCSCSSKQQPPDDTNSQAAKPDENR